MALFPRKHTRVDNRWLRPRNPYTGQLSFWETEKDKTVASLSSVDKELFKWGLKPEVSNVFSSWLNSPVKPVSDAELYTWASLLGEQELAKNQVPLFTPLPASYNEIVSWLSEPEEDDWYWGLETRLPRNRDTLWGRGISLYDELPVSRLSSCRSVALGRRSGNTAVTIDYDNLDCAEKLKNRLKRLEYIFNTTGDFKTYIRIVDTLLTIKTSFEKELKRSNKALRGIYRKIRRTFKRDRRLSFRNIVRFLFKNMDDNSGEENVYNFNSKHFLILNYHLHDQRRFKRNNIAA